jgi:fibronectin-binding autotransporter adhesin
MKRWGISQKQGSKLKAKASRVFAFVLLRNTVTSALISRGVVLVTLSLFAPISVLISVLWMPQAAQAASTLNFQGRLLTSTGALVPDGTYNMEFNLYGVATGGSTLWTEDRLNTNSQGVTVKNGYFSVYLGEYDVFGALNWNQDLWLGMTIRGTGSCAWGACTPADSEMTPRFKLTSVPYAYRAANVGSSNTSTASTNSQDVSVTTGNAAGATSNSGNITIDTGTATGTAGTISLGASNASALTLGRAGVTTTNAGALTVTQLLTANGGLTIAGGTNFGVYYRDGSGGVVTTAAGTSGQCLLGNTGSAPSWSTCPSSSLFTDAGSFTYLTQTGDDFVLGGNSIASARLYLDRTNFTLRVGTPEVGNGILSLASSGVGVTAPTISAGSTGNLTLSAPDGTVVLGSGTGNIEIDPGTTNQVIVGNTAGTGTITLGQSTASNTINIGTAAGNTNTQTINIGTSGTAGSTTNVTIGSTVAGTTILQGNTRLSALTTNGFVKTSGGNGALSVSATVALGSEVSGQLPIANGGTGAATQQAAINNLSGLTTTGDLLYYNGTNSTRLPRGTDGQCLTSNATTILWGACGGGGDSISVNGSAATDANFINTTATGTTAGITWSLNTTPSPDEISLTVSNASDTVAGVVTTGTQTFGGAKTFSSLITGSAGITTTGGAVSLTGNAASSLTTSSGALTLTSATAATWSTTSGSLTLNAGGANNLILQTNGATRFTVDSAAATLSGTGATTITGGTTLSLNSTGANAVSLDAGGAAAVNIGTTNATAVSLGRSGQTTTVNGALTATQLLSANGGLTVSGAGSLAVAAGTNFATTGTVNAASFTGSFIRFTGTGTMTLNGITGTADGRIITLVNTTANAITINHDNAGASAAERILTNTAAAVTLNQNQSASFQYDSTTQRWRMLATNVDGAGAGVTSIGVLDSQTKSANGAVISGNSLVLQTADGSNPGLVSTGTQTFGGAKTFSSLLTGNAGLTLLTGYTFTNASSTLFTAQSISNLPAGGNIGTAAATVDIATTFNVNQTTSGQTLTLPNPTVTTAGRIVYVNNVGSAGFSMYGVSVVAGTAQSYIWNGTNWIPTNIDGAGSGGTLFTDAGSYTYLTSTSDDFVLGATSTANGALYLQVSTSTLRVGNSSTSGKLVLTDGTGDTTTLQAGNSTGNLTFTLPTNIGSANQCIKNSGTAGILTFANCNNGSGPSGAVTLQDTYDVSTNPEITLSAAVGGLTVRDASTPLGTNLLEVQNNAGSTTYFAVAASGISVTGTAITSGALTVSSGGITVTGNSTITGTLGSLTGLTSSGTITFGGLNSIGLVQTNGSGVLSTGAVDRNSTTLLSGQLSVANGGTGAATQQAAINNLSGLTTTGDLLYYNGTNSTRLPRGTDGQCLTSNATTILWGACSGGGDSISVNGSAATDANFINTTATGTTAGITWSLNTTPAPDEISLTVSNASDTVAGVVTTGAQTFGGAKTFNSTTTVAQTAAADGLVITSSNASQTTTSGLRVTQSGTTTGFTGNFIDFVGSSTTGTGNLLNLTSVNTTNGNALNITANALTQGRALNIGSTGTGLTSGSLLLVSSATTGAVATNGIVSLNATGNYTSTSNAGLLNVAANATTAGTIANIQGTALTTGTALNINAGTGIAINTVGRNILTGASSGSDTALTVNNSTSTGSIFVAQDNGSAVFTIADGGAVTSTSNMTLQGGTLTLGTTSQAGSLVVSDGSSNTATIQVAALAGNYTVTIPTITGNDTFCLVTLANCGGSGSGVTTMAAIGSSPNANGATISGTTLTLQPADGSFGGVVTTSAQTFAGIKTFNNGIVLAANQSLTVTGGNTASRPGSPTEGMVYYDTDTKQLLTYANGKWQADRSDAILVAANNSSTFDKAAADYIADGTGDQVEINAALTAADPAGSGRKTGKVVLLAGTYVANETILIPNNTTLSGVGDGTLIQLADIDATDNLIENSDTSTGTGIVIRDLRLDGQNSLQTGAIDQHGIYLNRVGDSTTRQGGQIINTTITNFEDDGILLDNSDNIVIDSVVIRGNTRNGIYVYDSQNVTITNSIFQSNTQEGVYVAGVITGANNITVSGNTFRANTNSGITLSNTTTSSITGNTIIGGGLGIGMYSAANNNTITSNNIDSVSFAGVHIDSSESNIISSNRINNSGGSTTNNAFYLGASDFNVITNNTITDTACTTNCYAINITDSGSDKNYLEGNRFSGSSANAASINDAGTGTIYAGQQVNTSTSTASNVSDFRFRGSANSSTAFAVQNAAGNNILNIDTTNARVEVGAASSQTGRLRFYNSTNANTVTVVSGVTSSSYDLVLPTTAGSVNQCLMNDATTPGVLVWGACSGGGGDNISVNGSAATDANFINTTATGTTAGVTWSLNTTPSPDEISLTVSNASDTVAGVVTTDTQTFGGAKTFNSTTTVAQTAAADGLVITSSNASQTTTSGLRVTQSGTTTGFTGNFIDFVGSSTTGTGNLLNLTSVNTTNGNALNITANALTQGRALNIGSTGTGLTSGSLLFVSSATTGAVATNGIISLNATGNYTSTSNAGLLDVKADATAAGTIANISGNALTTGQALRVASTGTGLTSGSLLFVSSATTGAVATNGIISLNATGNYTSTSNAGLLDVKADATAAGTIANISGNALTTGQALRVASTGTGLTSGSLLLVSSATTGAVATNGIVSLNATGNYTSTSNAGLLNVAANATTAGTIANIQGTALTTGTALNINAGTGIAINTVGRNILTGASSGSDTALTVNNSTSTGSIFVAQDNGSAVFTIADGGAVTAANVTNSTAAFRVQSAASADTLFTADTTNNRIKVGNDTGSGTATTLLVLDSATSGTPTGVAGAMYYDATANKFKCFTTTWVDCDTTGAGGGGNSRTITLIPEYAGGVISADGSNNSGTMTSDYDSTNRRNYYNWTSNQGTLQDYDIVARSQIPSEYASGFGTFRIWVYAASTSSADNDIQVTVRDAAGTACATSVSVLPGSATTWTQQSVSLTGCSYAANDIVTVIVKVISRNNNAVRVGEISYQYTN